MKKCKFCGAEVNDNSKFCTECGKPFEEVEADIAILGADEFYAEQTSSVEPTIEAAAEACPPVVSDGITESVKEELAKALKEKKKVKRRKTIFFSLLAVVIAIAIICICVLTSPKFKLVSAMGNSLADLGDFGSSCENLINTVSTAGEATDSGKFTANMRIDASFSPQLFAYGLIEPDDGYSYEEADDFSDAFGMSAEFKMNYDRENKLLNGLFEMLYKDDDNSLPIDLEFSADADRTMFRIPAFLEDTYCFDNKTFGSDLVDSCLYEHIDIYGISKSELREIDFDPFAVYDDTDELGKEFEGSLRTFLGNVDVKKSNAKIVDFDGTVYRIYFEGKDLKLLVRDYLVISNGGDTQILRQPEVRKMLKELRESDYRVYAGIKDGKLTAFSIQINNDDIISFVLKGTENIWNSFSVYINNKEYVYGGVNKTDNGLDIKVKGAQENFTVLFTIDDRAGEASLTLSAFRTKAEIIKMNYSSDNGVASISFVLDPGPMFDTSGIGSFSVDMDVSPLDKAPEMLADKAVNILTMSERKFEELENELFDNLMNNPEFTWMFDVEPQFYID